MATTHDARSVANALISRGVGESRPRDPLQVIKLTYLCHGWMLGLYHRPMSAQPVHAWEHGPVIPDVYHGIKRYGKSQVTQTIDCAPSNFDGIEEDLIGQVFNIYGRFSGIELSQMTHTRGTPWHQVWHSQGRNAIIPNEVIEDHFSALAESE